MVRELGVVAAVLVTASLSAGGAFAQPSETSEDMRDHEARQLFEAGRTAFTDGRYEEALAHFERAFELSERPALLYNIGTTHDRLRHDDEAIESFEHYLEAMPDADNRRAVEARLRLLRTNRDERIRAEQAAAGAATAASTDDSGVHEQWWFWTLIGTAIAAGAVVTVLLLTSGDEQEALIPGDDGWIVVALE